MAKYRKVDPRLWNDEKFCRLSDAGKMIFFLMLTHPHMTPLGAMRHTPEGLGSELGWTPKASREAFREALREGLIEHDAKASFVGLPKFLKYNPPESPNVVTAWAKCWADIPECECKVQLYQRVKGFVEGLGKGYRKAFAEGIPESGAGAGTGVSR